MSNNKNLILYVDDDPDYRLVVRQVLEAAGYALIEAVDGEEGLRLLKEKKPDLVLVDLMMEEVDAGVSLLKQIREVSETLPVYLMSSVGDTFEMTTNAMELGFNGVFQKPVQADRLISVLESKLDS